MLLLSIQVTVPTENVTPKTALTSRTIGTPGAGIGFLPGVGTDVRFQTHFLSKPGLTVRAHVGFLARMYPYVLDEVDLEGCGVTAVGTVVSLDAGFSSVWELCDLRGMATFS